MERRLGRRRVDSLVRGRDRPLPYSGHANPVYCVDADASTHAAVSGSSDKWLMAWDLRAGKRVGMIKGHHKTVQCARIASFLALSGSKDSTARLWDVRTSGAVKVMEVRRGLAVSSVAFDATPHFLGVRAAA